MSHPVSSSAQVREQDRRTIEVLGVPGLALMETAGLAVAREVRALTPASVLVLAGRGNNGGDGWVVARHLHRVGVPVAVWPVSAAPSSDCAVQRSAAEAFGVRVVDGPVSADVVVDALLGTGLSSDLRGEVAERVAWLHDAPGSVVALDLPTGLCGDTGRVLGDAVRADVTVTFDRARLGHLLEPGADHTGRLVVADIGLVDGPAAAEILTADDIRGLLPVRGASSHKGSHGHVGVVAGSPEMQGAAVLVCTAALRAGAGLVTLHTDVVPRGLPPEVMTRQGLDLDGYDALVVGPGLGDADTWSIWADCPVPAVFDADGLRHTTPSAHPRAITPHPGEARRLLNRADIQADRLGAVRELGRIAPALLKGRHTLISGDPVRINRTGGPMLATAGSGDVLSGVVGALLARGLTPRDALSVGAFVHGLAGERLGHGLIASDLCAALPGVLADPEPGRPLLELRELLPTAE
ncbi:MAG: NAD(P)H-hydrate dehydratase [Proteobacteria bacterium]|nr:NAD(P)H-hydrate dehydratase [Pseudomonadota bacterium]MCP4915756.1 NAD(P)H-hydrate dehydratase [Pseudomonadota bacterium]